MSETPKCVCGHDAGSHDHLIGYCRAQRPRRNPCGCRTFAADANANRCTVPPDGWTCSRGAGHTGPCAAAPLDAGLRIEADASVPRDEIHFRNDDGRTVGKIVGLNAGRATGEETLDPYIVAKEAYDREDQRKLGEWVQANLQHYAGLSWSEGIAREFATLRTRLDASERVRDESTKLIDYLVTASHALGCGTDGKGYATACVCGLDAIRSEAAALRHHVKRAALSPSQESGT
jgi:hypothetical protein